MIAMKVTNYSDDRRQITFDRAGYCSPVGDMTRYINKMAMIGEKYDQLQEMIRDNLSGGQPSSDLQEVFETEFSALEYMITSILKRLDNNVYIQDSEEALMALKSDFRLARLSVKAKAMGAKSEMA